MRNFHNPYRAELKKEYVIKKKTEQKVVKIISFGIICVRKNSHNTLLNVNWILNEFWCLVAGGGLIGEL
jgi:hypothetical protein